jgi:ATP/maltotriose-dependent transcriptional regulator MalT/DNA-binding MarR family transcriptional regulator
VVRTYLRKRGYPVNERILIHLADRSEGISPDLRALTQEGIAATTACARTTASKRLLALERRGLVVGVRRHVPGFGVRKTTYGLTARGRKAAAAIRRRVEWDVVRLRLPDGTDEEVRFGAISERAGIPIDLATAMSFVTKGRLDLAALVSPERNAQRAGIWGEPARPPERLFGRAAEGRSLDGWLASGSPLLVVTGLPGIGKSALVSHWTFERRPRPHVFWHRLDDASSLVGVLADLGAFLASLGSRGLSAYLASPDPFDPKVLVNVVAHEMGGLPVLVVFDDFGKVPADVARDLLGLLRTLAKGSRTKAIVITRHAPRAPEGTVLRVRGLDVEASLALLLHGGRAGAPADLEGMAAAARGHPFLLKLLAAGGAGPERTVSTYLEEELWDALPASERKALEAASLLRRPAPAETVLRIAGVPAAAVARLLEKNLLEPTVSGDVIVHDVVREFVRGLMRAPRVRSLHRIAAGVFLRERDTSARIDALYHLLQADRAGDAAALLDGEGATLLDSGSAQEVAAVLHGSTPADLDASAECVFAEFRGDSLRIRGDLGPALFQYRRALAMNESLRDEGRAPRLLRKIAFIERCRTNYPEALGLLVEARGRLARRRDEGEEAEVLKEMALVEQATGDLAAAARDLNSAIDLATEASDPASMARGLLALGSLEAQRGARERGLEVANEARRIAEHAGNLTEAARASIVIGTVLGEMGRYHEELAHHERGLEVARRVGNLRLIAYATMNRAAALLDLGRYEDAGPPIEEAKQLFSVLQEKDSLAFLSINEGHRAMALGHLARAKRIWSRGLATLHELGNDADVARALKEVGVLCLQGGEAGAGAGYLEEARSLARRLGNAALLREIEDHLTVARGAWSPRGSSPA